MRWTPPVKREGHKGDEEIEKGKKNSQVREWKPCGVDVDLRAEPEPSQSRASKANCCDGRMSSKDSGF